MNKLDMLGGMIISVVLAAVGVCPIDFVTMSFVLGDTVILLGCLSLWSIIVHFLTKK